MISGSQTGAEGQAMDVLSEGMEESSTGMQFFPFDKRKSVITNGPGQLHIKLTGNFLAIFHHRVDVHTNSMLIVLPSWLCVFCAASVGISYG